MSDDHHLVVNVEEQIAKQLYDKGYTKEARAAITRAESLENNTPINALEMSRLVPVTKAEQAERKKTAAAFAAQNLRDERDALLAASDWTQLPDVPAEKQKAWAAYRQKLRDLPATTKDPAKVDWPKPPA